MGEKGAGRGLEEARNSAPQLLKEQEAAEAGMGSGVRQNAPDGAGSARIVGAEGPPSSPSGFGSDGARGREGRSGALRPLPRG